MTPTVSVLFHVMPGQPVLPALRSALLQQSDSLSVELLLHGPAEAVTQALAQLDVPAWRGGVQAMFGLEGAPNRQRNQALAAASGQWLTLLDAHTTWRPLALDKLTRTAAAHGADVCGGRQMLEGEGGTAPVHLNQGARYGHSGLLMDQVFPPGSFVLRRAAVKRGFNEHLHTLGDWLFLLDNVSPASLVLVDEEVCTLARSALNRSPQETQQRALDRARIYAMYPQEALLTQRQFLLSQGPAVDLQALMGAQLDLSLQVAQTPQGRYLICNPMETVQRSLLAAGAFEPAAHRIAEVFARETQGLVVDVGANLGAFSVPLANRMPEQRILAVEPQAMVFMNLCANLLLNKARKVKPVNRAIGSGGGQIRVPRFDVFSERFTGSVSLDQDVVKVRGAIQGVAEPQGWATEFDSVALQSLDELVGDELVSFIKIDVEGMELEVLKSAPHILARSQPVIFFEAWSLDEFKTQVDHLLTFVAAQGYEVIRIGSDCLAYPPARFSPEQVRLLLLQAGVAPG